MRKKISLATAIVFMLIASILTFQITYSLVEKEYQDKFDLISKTASEFSRLAEADSLIREHFAFDYDNKEVEDALLNGYFDGLGDPYSRYLTAEEYAEYQKSKTNSGNGIGVRLTFDPAQNTLVVYDVFQSSPAEVAGLLKGDVIVSINDNSVADLGFYRAAQALSGEVGTAVQLSVRRIVAAQVLEMSFTVERSVVQSSSLSYEMLDGFIGYVQLFSLEEGTTEAFSQALNTLQSGGAVGLIFDVRDLSDSSLPTINQMLDQLLPEGDLYRLTDRVGNVTTVRSTDGEISLPMAVIVNAKTSGCAELFASVLREIKAVPIIGEVTDGNSLSQMVIPLSDGSALILSHASFSPLESAGFAEIGITPDRLVSLDGQNHYLLSRDQDLQLQAAVSTFPKPQE